MAFPLKEPESLSVPRRLDTQTSNKDETGGTGSSNPLQKLQQYKQGRRREILIKRLDKLAEKHGLKYNRVFVRNQKTRWGSCSSKNNISLNAKLVKLPEKLMDYIILHELFIPASEITARSFTPS